MQKWPRITQQGQHQQKSNKTATGDLSPPFMTRSAQNELHAKMSDAICFVALLRVLTNVSTWCKSQSALWWQLSAAWHAHGVANLAMQNRLTIWIRTAAAASSLCFLARSANDSVETEIVSLEWARCCPKQWQPANPLMVEAQSHHHQFFCCSHDIPLQFVVERRSPTFAKTTSVTLCCLAWNGALQEVEVLAVLSAQWKTCWGLACVSNLSENTNLILCLNQQNMLLSAPATSVF